MLAPALKVVDAARALIPTPVSLVPGLWRLGIEPRLMAPAIRDLGEALSAFDRHSGNNNDAREMLGRAIRYAAERGVPVEDMIAAIGGGVAETEDEVRAIDQTMKLRPKPGEIGRPDPIQDGSPAVAADQDVDLAPRYQSPAPAFEPDPARVPRERRDKVAEIPINVTMLPAYRDAWEALAQRIGFEHDKAFFDAGDQQFDNGLELEVISERLEYAVKVHGWTPKLKALAAAWLHTRAKMLVDMDAGLDMAPQDAIMMAQVSADLARIEVNPELAYEPTLDEAWTPPTPKPPGFL